MKLKFNGASVFRTGQRLFLGTKSKTKTKKEANVKVNLSQQDRARWRRLLALVELFIKEQQGITEKAGFTLTGEPQTELRLDAQEKALLTALFKIVVLHFGTGRDISTIEESQLPTGVNAKDKQFARDTIERWQDEAKKFASEQPDSPPAVILEPTPSRKRIDKFYENNAVVGKGGREAYLPPPVLLAEREEQSK